MKKILLIIIVTFMSVTFVNAEENITFTATPIPQEDTYCSYSGCNNSFEKAYTEILEHYNTNYKEEYPYYAISYTYAQANKMTLHAFKKDYYFNTNNNYFSVSFNESINLIHTFYSNTYVVSGSNSFDAYDSYNNYYTLIDSNFEIIVSGTTFEIQGYYNDSIILEPGMPLPTYLNLKKYSSWSEYSSANPRMREVNLDNYEYVILNLKNYNRSNAFDTNLKVKGMIGITPVYEFGTIEKDNITDRCNISYEEYTDYRLYILKNDLINNAVYYVKSCEENSSFKFDSSVFNITYITPENVNDPVITFGGVQYNTIPFNKLSNSANKNEEDNYIPGETGSSLGDIITNSTKLTSNVWNAISSFMGLVTKFFNTLPEELRYLSITGFSVLIMIAIIKFLKG